jgi:hypothetical protein
MKKIGKVQKRMGLDMMNRDVYICDMTRAADLGTGANIGQMHHPRDAFQIHKPRQGGEA